MKRTKYAILFVFVFLIAITGLQGCTTSHSSKTVKTVETEEGNRGVVTTNAERDLDDSSTQTEKTVEEEKTTTHEKGGLLGTAFEFIGEVLAFPFRLAANIIEFVF